MLKHLRTVLATAFLGVFLVACGGNNDSAEAENTTSSTPSTASSSTTTAPAASQAGIIEPGTTRDALIAQYGKPDQVSERTLDSLEIEILEWNTKEGLVFAQLVNGEVTHGRLYK